jgi:hypothetical protein
MRVFKIIKSHKSYEHSGHCSDGTCARNRADPFHGKQFVRFDFAVFTRKVFEALTSRNR